ncbi:MAG: acyltransferase domain-containing protein, partial [Streptosporangiales bacterium]
MTTPDNPADQADRVRQELGLREALTWVRGLATLGPPPDPIALPAPDEAARQLVRMAVPEPDIERIVGALPDRGSQPALWWLLEREHHRIVRDMGGYVPMPGGPTLPYGLGDTARYFYVYVFLATVPAVRRFQESRGIPEDVAWATFTDLGEKVAIHRRKYGDGGMATQFWFLLHLRGVIYALGRLQFNLQRRSDPQGPLHAEQPVLGTHIPELGGPITPAACDDSLTRARPFFDRHFPEHGARVAVCTSWLLDPQLADYLPETSNIVSFMRRWSLLDEEPEPGDRSVLEFVFRRTDQPIDQLPQSSTLERAVVAHLRAGRHWR